MSTACSDRRRRVMAKLIKHKSWCHPSLRNAGLTGGKKKKRGMYRSVPALSGCYHRSSVDRSSVDRSTVDRSTVNDYLVRTACACHHEQHPPRPPALLPPAHHHAHTLISPIMRSCSISSARSSSFSWLTRLPRRCTPLNGRGVSGG